MEFTHFDGSGNAVMVDVSEKEITSRRAVAEGVIEVSREVMDAITGHTVKKGDVLTVAQVAGIMGTKRTSELIPMCHPLSLTNAKVVFEIMDPKEDSCGGGELSAGEAARGAGEQDAGVCGIKAICTASTDGKTGVEMEALTGVSTALLTIYDMCKALDKRMVIRDIHLVEKSGGRSGHFRF